VKNVFLSQLKPLKRRAVASGALKGLCVGAFLGVLVFSACAVAGFFSREVPLAAAVSAAGAFCVLGALAGALRARSLPRILRVADRRLELDDRLTSAWEFLERPPDAMIRLQVADATHRAARADAARAFPLRSPVPLYAYLGAIALAVAAELLPSLSPGGTAEAPSAKAAAVLPAVEDAAELAEQLEALERKAAERKLEESRRLARRLADAAKKLSKGKLSREQLLARAAEAESSESVGAARQLAELAEQLKRIEKILAKSKEWKPVAMALSGDDIARAERLTRELAELVRGGKIRGEPLQGLQRKLREAAEKSGRRRLMTLSKRRELSADKGLNGADVSKAVDSFADELEEMQSDRDKLEMLKSLAELARKLKGKAAEKMLARRADRAVKGGRRRISGLRPSGRPGGGGAEMKGDRGTGAGRGKAGGDKPGDGVGNQEGSKAGGEKTDAPKGTRTARIKGRASPGGRDRSIVIKSAALSGGSAVGYARIYHRARTAAERAVERNRLPLAERFLVKRYFELIAPTEARETAKENP